MATNFCVEDEVGAWKCASHARFDAHAGVDARSFQSFGSQIEME